MGRVRKIRIRYTGYGYVRREAGTGTKVEGPSLLSPQKFRCCNKLLGISCEKCGNAAAPRSSLILRHKNGSVQPASGYRTRPRAGDSSTAVSGTTALCICLFGYRAKSDHTNAVPIVDILIVFKFNMITKLGSYINLKFVPIRKRLRLFHSN